MPFKVHVLRHFGIGPARLICAVACCVFLLPGMHADDSSAGVDLRLVGSWTCNNVLGTLIFHTSFANGDFKRSIYDYGRLVDVSKGTWSADKNTFHIILLKRATSAHPDRFVAIDQHIDQEIVDVSANAYVVHEASAEGEGLMKWFRIGASDVSQYKADNEIPPSEPAPAPDEAPAEREPARP